MHDPLINYSINIIFLEIMLILIISKLLITSEDNELGLANYT